MEIKDQLDKNNIPKHVAIIMDGNGRWAQKAGEQRTFGHQQGVESVREAVEGATEIGIKHLTLYAFSTENWNRPQWEVNALMELLVDSIVKELPTFHKNGIRLSTIGLTDKLPERCQQTLANAIEETKDHNKLNLILALSYSGRSEIVNATKLIAQKIKDGLLNPSDLDEETFSSHLYTANIPDPELMIRTSGEFRISNFLLWQLAYSEIKILDILWPEFTRNDLYEAVRDYQSRERRFGKTGEQIKEEQSNS